MLRAGSCGGECAYDHSVLMDVPVPEKDEIFDDIFATAQCMPALESASSP